MKAEVIVKRSGEVRLEGTRQSAKLDHFANDQDVMLGIHPVWQHQFSCLPKTPA